MKRMLTASLILAGATFSPPQRSPGTEAPRRPAEPRSTR